MTRNAARFALAFLIALSFSASPTLADHHETPAPPPHGDHDHGAGHEKKAEEAKKDDAGGHEGHHEHEGHEGGHPKAEDKK